MFCFLTEKFSVVDFEEGPQMVPSLWLSPDREFCFWPSWANTLDQVRYDKAIKKCPQPEEDWGREVVLRVRASGGMFWICSFFKSDQEPDALIH